MEVEDIIKTKRYFELTAEELAEVSNYATSEVEFDDIKSFLLSTQQLVQDQKIKSTPELDDRVLNYLNQSYTTATPWYNSVLLFLFPRDKQFFKYPAFQLAIASLLVFGVFNMVNFSSFNESKMAFEDVQKLKVIEEKTEEVQEEAALNQSKLETESLEMVEENSIQQTNGYLSNEIESEEEEVRKIETFNLNFSADEIEEEVVINATQGAKPFVSKEQVLEEEVIQFDEDADGMYEAESITIALADDNVSSPAQSASRKDVDSKLYEKSSYKKAKGDAYAEAEFKRLATAPGVKQISIQATPELLDLFFEVK